MGKKKDEKHPALCIEDIVKDMPVLTESEMKNFYTYEEAVAECIRLFEEGIKGEESQADTPLS